MVEERMRGHLAWTILFHGMKLTFTIPFGRDRSYALHCYRAGKTCRSSFLRLPLQHYYLLRTMTTNLNPKYCYDSVGNGCKLGQGCRLRHDIQKCSCGLVLAASEMGPHLAGKRHRLLADMKQAELAQGPQSTSRQTQRPTTVSQI
jgi:hypothetical protein